MKNICSNCRFWNDQNEKKTPGMPRAFDDKTGDRIGACRGMKTFDTPDDGPVILRRDDGPKFNFVENPRLIYTLENFGCQSWEK